jgi:phage-related holin
MLFYFLNGYLIVDVDIVIVVVVVGHFLQLIKKTIQQKIERNLKERKNFKRILKERLIFGYCNQKSKEIHLLYFEPKYSGSY